MLQTKFTRETSALITKSAITTVFLIILITGLYIRCIEHSFTSFISIYLLIIFIYIYTVAGICFYNIYLIRASSIFCIYLSIYVFIYNQCICCNCIPIYLIISPTTLLSYKYVSNKGKRFLTHFHRFYYKKYGTSYEIQNSNKIHLKTDVIIKTYLILIILKSINRSFINPIFERAIIIFALFLFLIYIAFKNSRSKWVYFFINYCIIFEFLCTGYLFCINFNYIQFLIPETLLLIFMIALRIKVLQLLYLRIRTQHFDNIDF